MSDTLVDQGTEIFESLFQADGIWVLLKYSMIGAGQECIGPFCSEKDARAFRDSYFPTYKVAELIDPEDVVREMHA